MPLFEGLSGKLQEIAARMRGKVRVSEQDIRDMMREIRLALLEADVNYQVARRFVEEASARCLGSDVLEGLNPGQQVVKIVHDTLVDTLRRQSGKLQVSPSGFTTYLLVGLQGSGKTTTAAKLALYLRKKGKKPMLASVDVHRPAAARQLEVLAKQVDIPCLVDPDEKDAAALARRVSERARYLLHDTLIVDTAGRMTVDADLMEELRRISAVLKPTETLLVVDAMIGQESVAIATAFQEQVGIDGTIMTKLDGDARGGAALSIGSVTGRPLKLICTGEKLPDMEEFHPDRMASRILGMGDILSLIEKAQEALDEKKALETFDRMRQNRFTLQDMLDQFVEMKKMGPLDKVLDMLPGMGKKPVDASQVDPRAIDRSLAILRSMTRRERMEPSLLNASRRKRIASGSGTTVQEVNRLVRQYEEASAMMKRFASLSKGKRKGAGFPGLPF